ncbi:MAG: SDR family NAD(P)-dependent oxidoreductase [Trueperaceae bacterium]|nr:SDR family NAD(P)-dependent oxidoreductase [Trueperaceae bacterium]
MKVLVTGAAGFIGSRLSELLLAQGHEVVGLDSFDDYYDPARKRRRQEGLEPSPHFRMVEADIRDRDRLFALCREERFDAVAHLAALAGVRNAVAYPARYVEVDLNGSQHLMDAVLAADGVDTFVFASTSSVYGQTTQIPFVETDPCDRPLQAYAAAKRATEMLGHCYHHLYGLDFTAVRLFTVYGPGNRPDMMAHLVADSLATGKPIPLYEGDMRRDWTFVDDICDGIMRALGTPLGYEIFNLGRGEPVALRDFIDHLEALAGTTANLVPTPKPDADVEQTYADIGKARRLLGYDPQVSVAEGTKRLWDWYQQFRQDEADRAAQEARGARA